MRRTITKEEAVLDAKVFFLRNFFVRYKYLKSKSKQKGQTINLDEIWTAWDEFREFLKRKRQHGLQPKDYTRKCYNNFTLLCAFETKSEIIRALFSTVPNYGREIEKLVEKDGMVFVPHGTFTWKRKRHSHENIYLPNIDEVKSIIREGREEDYCKLNSGEFSLRLQRIIREYVFKKERQKKKPRGKPGCKKAGTKKNGAIHTVNLDPEIEKDLDEYFK